MDKKIQKTIGQITQLSGELKRCQRRLERISRARVDVYFTVPPHMEQAFKILYAGLEDMKEVLRGNPPRTEG